VLSILEPKLKQIGKIIDKLIDLPGPYVKGIFDFTALSAYVHTINDIWSKKNQLFLTPIWRDPLGCSSLSDYFDGEIIEITILTTLFQTSIILDWWLGKPQFDFWIGIIDLNFDTFPTQLEAYVHWCKFILILFTFLFMIHKIFILYLLFMLFIYDLV
jgi:hypothetical protein